jgi:hydrogenase maturation protease
MADLLTVPRSSPVADEAVAAPLLIVGLGNPMMADDGIGHEVVSRLERSKLPQGVRLCAVDGDVLTLVDFWHGEPAVWLVDAVSSKQPAGGVCVYEHEDLLRLPAGGLSTHHPNVSESLRWILHARPEMAAIEFRLYGIVARVVRPERRLSRAVEDAVDRLVDEIVKATRHPTSYSRASSRRRDENPGQFGDSAGQS